MPVLGGTIKIKNYALLVFSFFVRNTLTYTVQNATDLLFALDVLFVA